MELTAVFTPATLTAAGAARGGRLRGMIVPWNTAGDTSRGRLAVARGALRVPADPSRVKLTRGHDPEAPLGHLAEHEDTEQGLRGVFQLGSSPAAAEAAAEVAERVRDGLSVDLANVELDTGTDPATVVAADLLRVGLVPVPAYADARAEHHPDPATEEKETAVDIDPAATEVDNVPTPVAAEHSPADLTAAAQPGAPAAAVTASTTRTAPVSAVEELARRVTAAHSDYGPAGSARVLTAALSDITPGGNGAGNELAGLGTQAAGELSDESVQTYYDNCVTAQRLTGMKVEGFRWATAPTVGPYAGDKAEIPTNAAKLEYASVTASRLAGGHDLDRVYADLGSPSVLASYWRLMGESVTAQIDAARLAAVQADATTGSAATSVAEAVLAGLAKVPDATYIIIAADLYDAQGAEIADDLPAILSGAGIFGGGLPPVIRGVGLSGKVIAGRRSARDFYLLSPPLRLEAVNIAHAGIDAGVYSYYAPLTITAAGVHVETPTIAPPAAEQSGRGRK